MHNVVERLIAIQSEIKELLIKNNSQNKDINIVIVCKTFSMDKILPLIETGHVHFGENKVQEAELKWKEVKKKHSNIKLHLVGKLQTNKVKTALKIFDYIHSVDNYKLAEKIVKYEKELDKKIKTFVQINIGEEPNKGSDLYVETHKLLSEIPNFVGNIEGRHLLTSEADVLICDGFVGNTLLKFAESWITFFSDEIKDKVNEKLSYKIGAELMKPVFDDLKAKYDYEEHGGTPLLGVNGISIVCHGSSGRRSIMNSIFLGQKCIQNNLIEDTQKSLAIHFGH